MINPDFELTAVAAAAIGAALLVLPKVRQRLVLSLAKHPSLTGHVRWAKRLSGWLPGYQYEEPAFFASDGAPPEVVAQRKAGFRKLASTFQQRFPKTAAMTAEARQTLPDLQFTGAYRVPFPYSTYLRQHLAVGAFLESSDGVMVQDIDGNRLFDLTGSYGVNLFGYDFYKSCIAQGAQRVQSLGPVLGAGDVPNSVAGLSRWS